MKYAGTLTVLTLVLSFGALSGCGKTADTSYDTSTAEVLGESIGGAATASDSGGSVVAFNQTSGVHASTAWRQLLKSIAAESLESRAYASSCAANVMVQGTACSGNVMTLSLGGCNGLVGTWSGTATLTYSSGDPGACGNASASGLINMGANNSVTLTSSGGLTLTTYSGYTVETDSNSSGFSMPESGGTTVACGASGCSASRTVTLNGIHRALTSPTGMTLFDHTLNTPTGLSITGTGANKQITAGTIQLQHNLAHFIATAQITQPLTFSQNCCQPTGGQVAVTFSSGKTGSETVAFGPSCGVATVNGHTVSLPYCQ